MTQEDRELLLKDLHARLPYGVKVSILGGGAMPLKNLINSSIGWYVDVEGAPTDFSIDEIKPYLRPMSSMTEEEGVEWRELLATYPLCAEFNTDNRGWLIAHSDFILSHHFDIWNLIEKRLAIEAPDGMYKF